MTPVQVGVDTTDHMSFFCECGKTMKVTNVRTIKWMTVNYNTGHKDNCTWVYVECVCGKEGHRKFYWTCGKTQFVTSRTKDLG